VRNLALLTLPHGWARPGFWNRPLGPWKRAHVFAVSTSAISSQKGTEQ
jgi:hypothetical protein